MARRKRTQSKNADATANDRVKKAKSSSFATQRMITVLVGDQQTPFHIHADVLSANSAAIKAQIDNYDSEEELKPIVIGDVTPETFNTFATWIYAKKLPTDGVAVDELEDADDASSDRNSVLGGEDEAASASNDDTDHEGEVNDVENNVGSESNAGTPSPATLEQATDSIQDTPHWDANLNLKGRVFGRLVDAFVFATRYNSAAFLKAVMLQLQRCIYNYKVVPCPTVVKRALDSLELDSSLCRYLILCYGHYTDYEKMSKVRLATLPADFLVAVLDIAFKRIDGDAPSEGEDWCEFHEHDDDAERKECEDGRCDDPDVREKKEAQRRPVRRSWMARTRGCC